MSLPTIYLTNAATVAAVARDNASEASRACVGLGPVYSIMRFPRADIGEAGAGRVLALTPPRGLAAPAIAAKKATDAGDDQADAWRKYEEALRALWMEHAERLEPGRLAHGRCISIGGGSQYRRYTAEDLPWDGDWWAFGGQVEDGATLICACGRKAAADGRCHRVIAADLLAQAGWQVVLDGQPLNARPAAPRGGER